RCGSNSAMQPIQAEIPTGCTLDVEQSIQDGAILVIRGTVEQAELSLALRVHEQSPWFEVYEVLSPSRTGDTCRVAWLEAVWRFVGWQSPGEVYSPVLVPEPGDVVGRHVMRAPAITAQSVGRAAALVNDVDWVGRVQNLPACMNLLREKDGTPQLRTGLRPHQVRGHVYYRHSPADAEDGFATIEAERPLHHAYHLYVAAHAPPGAALDVANRRLWSRFGTRQVLAAPPMPATFEDLARQIYPRVFDSMWSEVTLDNRRVGAVCLHRSYPNDVWMSPWFSQLRSAYGLYIWGQDMDVQDWVDRAVATRDLHLAAPQQRGLFPTVFVFGDSPETCRWVHSHHQGGGLGIYHLFDMSWTAYQLLRWHRDLLPDRRSLDFVRAYAHGLVDLQNADGSLPAYVDATTFEPVRQVDLGAQISDLEEHGIRDGYVRHGVERMWGADRFTHSAEDAGSLLLLAELARVLPEGDKDRTQFVNAATRIARWLESWVFPESRWLDFEVTYSCSPKHFDYYDRRSGQWPQNTLSMHAAAAGLLALYEVTDNESHLALARRAMDRLSLYQQVWDPPFLNFYGFGGYGVMNTDGEWSDARQAQFADTHFDFYRVLSDDEHLERAVSACRAGFTTLFLPSVASFYPTGWHRSPQGLAAENHAHGGRDGLCGVSSFDWGAGSALATAAYLRRRGIL
ncbi:MAG: hypothetical protein MUQ10_03515, partial [Anaerolineae bacterium]|nr:hypothetical protein [Anaerolineae bacterium]